MRIRALFQELTNSSHATLTEASLKKAVAEIATSYGYDRFAYLNLDTMGAGSFAVSNYPRDWQKIYFDRSYTLVDPVVTMGKRIMRAFSWSVNEQRRRATQEERGFWDAASAFSIRAGLTVPIRVSFGQTAMLTLASPYDLKPIALRDVECLAAATSVAFLHSRFGGTDRPTTRRRPGLTDREALCLKWVAAGKTMMDIAVILGVNYHTVRWDLDNVRAKLNVKNLRQAISRAIKLRLI
ncbi:autoinducer binding domain-containing protein [Rhizobium mesoamericanum]|uniref:Transcriptional regulator, LuxR family n=1 Tax=Rhizobium mesoamericanum STM3625 TaxID=1211777 RepID=K0Q4M8_9HYPH|nr:autoinducer binding domain-containing protein [Rhizobium mesoamericanum]CCM79542.1 Transcriptional regulator, LuxR family [Rhizobium mesoamericanum STM3625]